MRIEDSAAALDRHRLPGRPFAAAAARHRCGRGRDGRRFGRAGGPDPGHCHARRDPGYVRRGHDPREGRNDLVYGRAAADRLYGEAGNDVLAGGPGNDVIVGGSGRDVISCGAGHDRAVADGTDRVAMNCERLVGAVRGPGGRLFPAGAVFSAGVTGDGRPAGSAAGTGSLPRNSPSHRWSGCRPMREWSRRSSPGSSRRSGTAHLDSQTEPWVDVNPANRSNVVGFWQEDRWSTGGARNLVFGTSFDGGATWTNIPLQGVSRWRAASTSVSPTRGSTSGRRTACTPPASRSTTRSPSRTGSSYTSTDGGLTWGPPVTVTTDTEFQFFNDKQALMADDYATSPFRGNVYVSWDRLEERATGQPVDGHFTGPRTSRARRTGVRASRGRR